MSQQAIKELRRQLNEAQAEKPRDRVLIGNLKAQLDDMIGSTPNERADEVPRDADVVVRHWPLHVTPLSEPVGKLQVDYARAVEMSGSKFAILRNREASLERALGQFMIDLHVREHGYEEVSVPLMVRAPALKNTGQLPKFEEDLFKTTSDHYLIPTAEVPLTNLFAGQLISTLPQRVVALTPCFRAEAGTINEGLFRQHQFYKCELVSVTLPDQSDTEHERMTNCAEDVLERLQLPYRRVLLCDKEMGFSARKTYDLEVWMPSQQCYREVSSSSNCGDFQARRMNTRYEKGKFAHTLNASGLAVGRTLLAFRETHGDVLGPLGPYVSRTWSDQ